MEVTSADKATKIAKKFLQESYVSITQVQALKKDKYWQVEMDVGIFEKKIMVVKIDVSTGEIIEYFPA